jgi:hypothetical protein
MTSEEIKQKQAVDLSTNGWLREVCIQLALLNEKGATPPREEIFSEPLEVRVKRAYTKRT